MTNLERVAYIRGLAEGLELDTDKKEVKVLDVMLTLLEVISTLGFFCNNTAYVVGQTTVGI